MYKTLTKEQMYLLHPGRENTVTGILRLLEKQKRIHMTENTIEYIHKTDTDHGMIKAVWVLTDFIANVEYHSAGEFPIKLTFFSDGIEYAVIYAETGKEALINRILSQSAYSGLSLIVIVDTTERISALTCPGISVFCTVADDGRTNYYKTKNGGE